jgi:hypothetical protein
MNLLFKFNAIFKYYLIFHQGSLNLNQYKYHLILLTFDGILNYT